MPQRKLFKQKENKPQNKFGQLVEKRETLSKLHKSNAGHNKSVNIGPRELFNTDKQKNKNIFPANLLDTSLNKTDAVKSKEKIMEPPKNDIRNIFSNRPRNEFFVSESEDEFPDLQPKAYGLSKKSDQKSRTSTISQGRREPLPASSFTTDIELDDWRMLPSSTMVADQLEEAASATPVKRARLSKLSEAKESNAGTNSNATVDKNKQCNKSVTSKNKSKNVIRIRPSMAPPRESTGLSDGARDSSAEGSGWDSHRTTRKTLRQTFGKDFTPRKSLRALVMEKSAKRQTYMDARSDITTLPQADATEYPEMSNHDYDADESMVPSDHELSRQTRQAKLEIWWAEIKKKNMERWQKTEMEVRNLFKPSAKENNPFNVPARPMFSSRRVTKPVQKKSKPKQINALISLDDLPQEILDDLKYKPPKRFSPASWTTKRLYKFLETKLEPKYDYKARIRAEKLVKSIYHFSKELRRHDVAPTYAVDVLKHEMARLEIVKTHFEFYEFFNDYMPREIRVKVVPDIVNKISMPKHGIFSEIQL